MVELRGVSYRVGEVRIVNDVSVRFRPGTFTAILGPNGAGKSTLLKLATGLLAPTRGEVRYDDRVVGAIPGEELARRRAVLSQHVELAFPLPVADVVLMGRYPYYARTPAAHDLAVVRQALDLVGMSDRAGQPYPTLSGGERQKTQLARVLAQIWPDESGATSPRCLFLDEPTTSLDVHYQLHLLDVARGLLAREVTVVAVLHDLNVALRYGGHFVLLERGAVALDVDDAREIPADVLERVFQVRAERVGHGSGGDPIWRFSL